MACVGSINGESFQTDEKTPIPDVFPNNDKPPSPIKQSTGEGNKVARRDTYKAMQRFSDFSSDRPLLDQNISEKSEHKRTSKNLETKDKRNTAPALSFPESLGEIVFEGNLKSKNTFTKSKYSGDRAWKNVHAVLRDQCLCLHPDQLSTKLVVYSTPILMQSSFVDIAYDYTKKPNVFRLMTLTFCEFLFEASSPEDMLEWIKVLQRAAMPPAHKTRKKALRSSLKRYKNKRSKSSASKPSSKHKGSFDNNQSTNQFSSHSANPPTTPLSSSFLHLDPHNLTTAGTTTAALSLITTTTSTTTTITTSTTTTTTSTTTNLQPAHFMQRLRSRSPDARSSRHHPSFHLLSPPSDNSKTENKGKSWRVKMVERFKRVHSHPGFPWLPLSPPTTHSPFPPTPHSSQPPTNSSAAFKASIGVCLESCVASAANEHLPLLVETCIGVIEGGGCEGKGIYRVPGNNAAIAILHAQVDQDPEGLSRGHEKWNDTNAVVSLLKLFFRRLPQPLATRELYESFIQSNNIQNNTERLTHIKQLLHQLPPHNFETFKALSAHLFKVSTLQHTNMMDTRNLSIVFGPTLLQPPIHMDSMVVMVRDMTAQCQVIQAIITRHDWLFGEMGGDDDGGALKCDNDNDNNNTPISSMQQQLIQKAQLLGQEKLEIPQPPDQLSSSHLAIPPFHPDCRGKESPRNSSLYSLQLVYGGVGSRESDLDTKDIAKHYKNVKEHINNKNNSDKDPTSHNYKSHKLTPSHKKKGDKDTLSQKSSRDHSSHKSDKTHRDNQKDKDRYKQPDTPSRGFRGPVSYIGDCFRGRSVDKEDDDTSFNQSSSLIHSSNTHSCIIPPVSIDPPTIVVQSSEYDDDANNTNNNTSNNTNNNNNNSSEYSSTVNTSNNSISDLSNNSTNSSACSDKVVHNTDTADKYAGADNDIGVDKLSPKPPDSGRMSDNEDFSDSCLLVSDSPHKTFRKKHRTRSHKRSRNNINNYNDNNNNNNNNNQYDINQSSTPDKSIHKSNHKSSKHSNNSNNNFLITCSSGFLLPPKVTFKNKRSRSSGRRSKGDGRGSGRNSVSSDIIVVSVDSLRSSVGESAGVDGVSSGVVDSVDNKDVVVSEKGKCKVECGDSFKQVVSEGIETAGKDDNGNNSNEDNNDGAEKTKKKDDEDNKTKKVWKFRQRSYSIDSIFHHTPSIKLTTTNPSPSHLNHTPAVKRRLRLRKGSHPTSPIINKAINKLYSLLGTCGRSMEGGLDGGGLDESDGGDDKVKDRRVKSRRDLVSGRKGSLLGTTFYESQPLLEQEHITKSLAFESSV